MKTLKIICFAIIAIIAGSSCQSNQESNKSASDIIGAYEYTGNLEGIALYDESHFAFTFRTKTNKPDSAMTCEERFNSIESNAGTWTVKDSIVTLTITFHKDPKMIGTIQRFVYKNIGNEHNYRLIDQNGRTIGKGTAIKIK